MIINSDIIGGRFMRKFSAIFLAILIIMLIYPVNTQPTVSVKEIEDNAGWITVANNETSYECKYNDSLPAGDTTVYFKVCLIITII